MRKVLLFGMNNFSGRFFGMKSTSTIAICFGEDVTNKIEGNSRVANRNILTAFVLTISSTYMSVCCHVCRWFSIIFIFFYRYRFIFCCHLTLVVAEKSQGPRLGMAWKCRSYFRMESFINEAKKTMKRQCYVDTLRTFNHHGFVSRSNAFIK